MSPDTTRLIEEGVLERAVQEATLLAERLGPGQRHVLPLSEVQRVGPRLQPTADGDVVAVLDLRALPVRGESVRTHELVPLTAADLGSLPVDGMLKRADGVPAIPVFRIHEQFGPRTDELAGLLRSVCDEDVLVLQAPHAGDAEAIPLAVALWRRLLFTGHGWKVRHEAAPRAKKPSGRR